MAIETAEFAVDIAPVGVVDIAIYNIGDVSLRVNPLADGVGCTANRQ